MKSTHNRIHFWSKLILGAFLFASSIRVALASDQSIDSETGSTRTGMDKYSTEELLSKGVNKMQEGFYNQARMYFEETRIRSKTQDSTRLNILAITNIGSLFYYLNEPDSALSYYYLALDMAEQSDQLNLQNTINNNIGIIYASTGHSKDAKVVLEKALAISVLLDDTFKIALNLSNLGAQNIFLKEFWAAKGNLLRAESYYVLLGDSTGLTSVYSHLGELYYVDSNYNEALISFKKSLLIAKHNKIHAIELPPLYNNIGRTHFALNNNDMAISYFDSAYQFGLESNQLEQASISLNWLIQVFSKLNQPEQGLVYAWKSLEIKDSIIKLEKENWIEESKVKYQFELKEREYALLKENSSKRTFFVRVILVALIIIIILLVVILNMRMKASKLKEKRHKAEKIVSKAKLSQVTTRNLELEEKIETINYELVSKTLLIDNKNQILDSIGSLVSEAELNDEVTNKHVRQLKQHLLRDNNVEQNWADFKVYFERVHTDFFQKIHKTYPHLTSRDLRLTAFVLLQFNAKEIAQILNISPDSVRKRKQRLREKLDLKKGDDLLNYLYSYTS